MTNNEKFNKLINDSDDPLWMLAVLGLMLGKPCAEQTDKMLKELDIPVGELLSLADQSHCDKKAS